METLKTAGIKFVTWLKDIKQTCPRCLGQKKVKCNCDELTRLRKCPSCGGSGETTIKRETAELKEISKCEECKGKKFVYCSSCEGAGVITNSNGKEVKCIDCMGESIVTCVACNGTGAVYEEVKKIVEERQICERCKGAKKVKCNFCDVNHLVVCPTCKGKGTTFRTTKLLFICAVVVFIGFVFGWI